MGRQCLMGTEFPVQEDGKVLEMDGDQWLRPMPLNWVLKHS